MFSDYGVLSERELHSRYDVFVEQYVVKVNIEAETAASIARTMLLPAAVRHLEQLKAAEVAELATETEALVGEFVRAIKALEAANATHEGEEGSLEHAKYMRDAVLPGDGRRPRRRRPPREDRGRRPVAAAEVRGDALHQVAEVKISPGKLEADPSRAAEGPGPQTPQQPAHRGAVLPPGPMEVNLPKCQSETS